MKLNLGCGLDYRQGFVNVEKCKKFKADKYIDLEREKWDFEDESADYIEAHAIFEHIRNPVLFFTECYRILKPNGILHIVIPNFLYWKYIIKIIKGNYSHSNHWDIEHISYNPNDLLALARLCRFSYTWDRKVTGGLTMFMPLIYRECFFDVSFRKQGGTSEKSRGYKND